MPERLTSRVFAAWRALYQRIADTPLPPPAEWDADPVEVFFGIPPETMPREAVYVAGRIDEATSEWATLGHASRDESLSFLIRFDCGVPGATGLQVLDRLEQVADAIQVALRDPDTGLPVPLGFTGEVKSLSVARVEPVIQVSDEGAVGRVDLTVSVTARI